MCVCVRVSWLCAGVYESHSHCFFVFIFMSMNGLSQCRLCRPLNYSFLVLFSLSLPHTHPNVDYVCIMYRHDINGKYRQLFNRMVDHINETKTNRKYFLVEIFRIAFAIRAPCNRYSGDKQCLPNGTTTCEFMLISDSIQATFELRHKCTKETGHWDALFCSIKRCCHCYTTAVHCVHSTNGRTPYTCAK